MFHYKQTVLSISDTVQNCKDHHNYNSKTVPEHLGTSYLYRCFEPTKSIYKVINKPLVLRLFHQECCTKGFCFAKRRIFCVFSIFARRVFLQIQFDLKEDLFSRRSVYHKISLCFLF